MSLPDSSWHGTLLISRASVSPSKRVSVGTEDHLRATTEGTSDAEHSSTFVRKRGCVDLHELMSRSSWETAEGHAAGNLHGSLKRVCCSCCTGEAAAAGGALHFLESVSAPSSTDTHVPSNECPARPATPSAGNPAAAAAAAAGGTALKAEPSATAATAGASIAAQVKKQQQEGEEADASDCRPTLIIIRTSRTLRSGASSLSAGTWQLGSSEGSVGLSLKPAAVQSNSNGEAAAEAPPAAAAKSRSSSTKERQQQQCNSSSAAAVPSAATRVLNKGASKRNGGGSNSCSQKADGSSSTAKDRNSSKHSRRTHRGSGSSSIKGPRLRLGGKLLSPEEAERHLKEAAAAAAAAAAKAAAAQATAAAAATENAEASAVAGGCSRVASPCLGNQQMEVDEAAATAGMASVTEATAAAKGPASSSSNFLGSPQASSMTCHLDQPLQAAHSSYGAAEPPPAPAAAAAAAGIAVSSGCLAGDSLACIASAAVDVPGLTGLTCADLDMTDQMTDQLPDDFIPTPNQISCWPTLEASLADLDATAAADPPATAAAAGERGSTPLIIGSAAAGAGLVRPEPMYSSPFLMSCTGSGAAAAAAASSPTMAPAGQHSLAAAAAARGNLIDSRNSSCSSLLSEAMIQRSSCNTGGGFTCYNSSYNNVCNGSYNSSMVHETGIGRVGGSAGGMLPAKSTSNQSFSSPYSMAAAAATAATVASSAPAAPGGSTSLLAAEGGQCHAAADAEIKQLLVHWGPAADPAAAAAASAPADFGMIPQQLLGGSSSSHTAPTSRVAFAGQQRQQLVWKPAFSTASTPAATGCTVYSMMPAPPASAGPAAATAVAASRLAMPSSSSCPVNFADGQQEQLHASNHGAGSSSSMQQQQQLMAMVDKIVQQRLAQSFEAGFMAAAQMNGCSSNQQSAAAAAAAAATVAMHTVEDAAAAAVAAAAAPATNVTGMAPLRGFEAMQQQQLAALTTTAAAAAAVPAMPKVQLVDDILPSMQDLLTDCSW